MSEINFSNFLTARMKEKGVNAKRLAEATGISPAHLEALISGDASRLPPAPYVHGYLTKIGQTLDFDPAEWWEILRRSLAIRRSGSTDSMPKNRFILKRSYGKLLVLMVIVLIFLGYWFFRSTRIIGRPDLVVNEPAESGTVTVQDFFDLSGEIRYGDKVLINGEATQVAPDGSWQKKVILQPGVNIFEIRGEKMLGRSASLIRRVTYNPPATSTNPIAPTVNSTSSKSNATSSPKNQ